MHLVKEHGDKEARQRKKKEEGGKNRSSINSKHM